MCIDFFIVAFYIISSSHENFCQQFLFSEPDKNGGNKGADENVFFFVAAQEERCRQSLLVFIEIIPRHFVQATKINNVAAGSSD
jgi:hypothetical protein